MLICVSNVVCAIEHTIKPEEKSDEITEVIPIAGELKDYGGGSLDAKVTRLKTSESQKDSVREGLRIELNGGYYDKRKQKAIVEFICDAERTGLETDFEPEDKYEGGDEKSEKGSPSLTFVKHEKYVPDTEVDTLWLEWRTKYACEDQQGDDAATSGRWGFFTWLLIM